VGFGYCIRLNFDVRSLRWEESLALSGSPLEKRVKVMDTRFFFLSQSQTNQMNSNSIAMESNEDEDSPLFIIPEEHKRELEERRFW
jgi:hypothetical protein